MANKKIKTKVETEDQKKYRELVESIAGNIASLANSVTALLNGPVKKRAIVLLLASSSGQSQHNVEQILKALESLKADWLK